MTRFDLLHYLTTKAPAGAVCRVLTPGDPGFNRHSRRSAAPFRAEIAYQGIVTEWDAHSFEALFLSVQAGLLKPITPPPKTVLPPCPSSPAPLASESIQHQPLSSSSL